MIYTHKLTGQKLLLKKSYGGVSSCYVLDPIGRKIPDENKNGVHLKNADGSPSYKIFICKNENLIKQNIQR